mmetsp:Transcript_54612/g.132641  ORF Transcript_54612/g.132641 Transcript_54612/m.132641 type:complete len:83 (-) Transcript_54612:378-626(-)
MPWTVPSRKNGHVIQNMTGNNNNDRRNSPSCPYVYTVSTSEQEVTNKKTNPNGRPEEKYRRRWREDSTSLIALHSFRIHWYD